jgi:hypothetical protein
MAFSFQFLSDEQQARDDIKPPSSKETGIKCEKEKKEFIQNGETSIPQAFVWLLLLQFFAYSPMQSFLLPLR